MVRKQMMDPASSSADIKQLRRHARSLGLSIRTRRASKSQPTRAYDLIEVKSGRVVHSRLTSPEEIEAVLRSIVAKPTTGGVAHDDGHTQRCPTCGTVRLGFFRWCQSCGHDFEEFKSTSDARQEMDAASLAVPDSPTVGALDTPAYFCEFCGREQLRMRGGRPLTRNADGAYLCERCEQRAAAQRTSAPPAPLPVSAPQPSHDTPRIRMRGLVGLAEAIAGLVGRSSVRRPGLTQDRRGQ